MNAINNYLAEKGIFLPGAAANFEQEDQSDKVYSLEIDNIGTSAVDRIIAIAPGDNYSAVELSSLLGVTVDAVLADGEIVSTSGKEVNAAGTPGQIKSFLKSVRRAPQRFVGLTIEVSQVTQLSQPLKVYKDDPYTGDPVVVNQIFPSQAKSNTQNNDKLVHIPLSHFQLDADTIVTVLLKAGGSLTLNWVPGAKQSTAELLTNEALKEFNAKNLKREYKGR